MTDDERALLLATAKAIAHFLEEGATELDGDHKRQLLALIPRVEARGLPQGLAR